MDSIPNQNRIIMFLMASPPACRRIYPKVNASSANSRTEKRGAARLLSQMRAGVVVGVILLVLGSGWIAAGEGGGYFVPSNRLSGIGVDRENMSQLLLEERTRLMIEAQTFSILREPQALAGARRITSPAL